MRKKFISIVLTACLIFGVICVNANATEKIKISYDPGKTGIGSFTVSNTNPTTADVGQTIKLQSPSCEGFDFLGWYADSRYTEKIESICTDEDITVYGEWEFTDYKINYSVDPDVNVLSFPGEVRHAFLSDFVMTEPVLSDDRYVFVCWRSTENDEIVEKIDKNVCRDVCVYGEFSRKTFEIYYDLNTTRNYKNDNPMSYIYGDEFVLAEPVLYSTDNISFDGWYLDESFTRPISEIKPTTYGNLHLYAKWKTKSVQDETKINYVVEDLTNNVKENMVSNDNKRNLAKGETYSLRDPSCPNDLIYFDGWYLDKDFSPDSRVTTIKDVYDEEITLYAKWSRKVVNILYDLGTLKNKNVKYENDNPLSVQHGSTFKLSDLKINSEGYTFIGWYEDSSYTKKCENLPLTNDTSLIVYAQVIENNYTITYNLLTQDIGLDNKYLSNPNPNFRSTSTELNLQNAQSRNVNFAFLGWYTDSDFTKKIEKIDAYTCKNFTLYAKWSKVLSYIPKWGDVSLSGGIQASDARIILRAASKLEKLGEVSRVLSDIDNDGRITAKDARIVLRLSAKLDDYSAIVIKYNLPAITDKNGVICIGGKMYA